MTNVRVDGGEPSSGATQKRWWDKRGRLGKRERERDEMMALALSSTLLLQSPRQHAWRALERGVIAGKNKREAGM